MKQGALTRSGKTCARTGRRFPGEKRIFAALLAFNMVLALLPGTALATGTVVSGAYSMDFTINNADWHNGVSHDYVDEYAEGTGWKWFPHGGVLSSGVIYPDRTLLLDDFHFTTSAAVALKLPAGSTVVVSGNNTFTSGQATGADDIRSIGISVHGDLMVEGSGTLTGQGGSTTATSGTAQSFGVYLFSLDASKGNITVSSGTLTGKGGSVTGTESGASYGVVNTADIEVSGGTLSGQGGSARGATSSLSCGVSAYGSIAVRDGTLTGTGSDATGGLAGSYGVRSGSATTVSGGTLNGTGGSVSGASIANSQGVSASNNITVSGGAVTAKSAMEAIHAAGSGGFGFSGRYATAANRQVAAGATAGTASPWTGTVDNELNGNGKPNPYAYVRITPAALPITITSDTAFPVGMSGGDRTVTVGHGTGLVKGEIGALSADGNTLTENTDYTKTNRASVDITLKESWLNSLPAGTHRLNVAVTSGVYAPQTPYVDIVVMGTGGTDVPKTGDGSMPLMWAGLALLARKKRRRVEGK